MPTPMIVKRPKLVDPKTVPASTGAIRPTSPILLSGSRVYKTNEASAVNQKALINHSGFPAEILEIRFQILPASGDTLTGGAFACRLTYNGEHPMTNSFVPVWSFARSYNMIDEMGLTASNGVLGLRLKLARPLWLPPGGFLTAEFQNLGLTQNDATAQIGLAGRVLLDNPPPPRKLYIPYISSYTSKDFDAYGATDTDASSETNLINPFQVPLRVQRFTHHTNIFDTSGTLNHEYDSGYADIDSNLFQIRMMSSKGEPVIPVFSTMNQVFSRMTRSWECEHDLHPDGYYLVYLNKLAPTIQSANTIQVKQFIGMVGYREVAR